MRIRTIRAAHQEVKAADPGTCITETAIRNLVVTGRVPSIKHGRKYLISMDDLYAYFEAERRGAIKDYFDMLLSDFPPGEEPETPESFEKFTAV